MSQSYTTSVLKARTYDSENGFGAGSRVRPLFVSTYVPTRCGLAMYTKDLADAVDEARDDAVSSVLAVSNGREQLDYSNRVMHTLDADEPEACGEAAEFCNESDCSVVCLQHDYSVYPGKWGESVLGFAENCEKPLVTTLHNLKLRPEPTQRYIVRELVAHSDAVVVPSSSGRQILDRLYGLGGSHIHYIPHGVHLTGSASPDLRSKMDLEGRTVLMTHGLLGRDKGIEYMIDGMTRIKEVLPRSLYVVAGRTHPKLPAPDIYRKSLREWAGTQGVAENVLFIDRFLSMRELMAYLACTDVYVSPCPVRDQMVSGSLAYALGAGKAVVSTPYTYAREMWQRGVLMLGNFRDGPSLAEHVLRLIHTPRLKSTLERRARSFAQTMSWEKVGQAYSHLFDSLSEVSADQFPANEERATVSV